MRLLLPIFILVAALLASLAFERPSPPADLTTGVISIETIDPQVAQATDDIRLIYAMFEGLTTFDPMTFTVIPGQAARWDVSDDGTVYTFHLRPDLKWSDGTPLTTEDFRYAWRVGMMPDTAPPYAEFLYFIKGGHEFANWALEELKRVQAIADPAERRAAARQRLADSERKFDEIVGVKVIDRQTIQVTTARPLPYFLEIVACWPLFPLPKHVLEKVSAIDPSTLMLRRDQQWTRPGREPETMIVNGPYRLVSWRFKRELYFEANEHYSDTANVDARTLRIINYQTTESMFNAYASGTLDIMFGAQALKFCPSLIEAQQRGERDDVFAVDNFGTYYYAFNCRPTLPDGRANPFADPRVRKAFALSADKRALVEQVTRLRQTVADVFIPAGSIAGYDSPGGLGYDPERARQLLAEAGYPEGRGLPTIEISYNTGGGHEDAAQALGRMWARALGVKVSFEAQEWKVFLDRRQRGQFMIARSGWSGDYGDPTTFLDLFRIGNGHNDPGYHNPAYDRLLDEAAATTGEARMNLLERAEAMVVRQDLPILPLYHYQMINLHDEKKITNVSEHPRQIQMFHRMKMVE